MSSLNYIQLSFTLRLCAKYLMLAAVVIILGLWHKISNRSLANNKLDIHIKEIYMQHRQRYGAPRITKSLNSTGIICSECRVARRMQHLNLKAIAKSKFKVTTDSNHTNPVYDNILNRDCTTTAINQKWVADITWLATKEGWLYLAVVIDLHSRAVICWSMRDRINKN